MRKEVNRKMKKSLTVAPLAVLTSALSAYSKFAMSFAVIGTRG
jgi:hypothetical protein